MVSGWGEVKGLEVGFFSLSRGIFPILYSIVFKTRTIFFMVLYYFSKWACVSFEKLGSHGITSFSGFKAALSSWMSFVPPSHKLHWVSELNALLGASLLSLQVGEERSKHRGAKPLRALHCQEGQKLRGTCWAISGVQYSSSIFLFSATCRKGKGTHW